MKTFQETKHVKRQQDILIMTIFSFCALEGCCVFKPSTTTVPIKPTELYRSKIGSLVVIKFLSIKPCLFNPVKFVLLEP